MEVEGDCGPVIATLKGFGRSCFGVLEFVNIEKGSFGSFDSESFDFALESVGGIGTDLEFGGVGGVGSFGGNDVQSFVFGP